MKYCEAGCALERLSATTHRRRVSSLLHLLLPFAQGHTSVKDLAYFNKRKHLINVSHSLCWTSANGSQKMVNIDTA